MVLLLSSCSFGIYCPGEWCERIEYRIDRLFDFDSTLRAYILPLKYVVDTNHGVTMQKHWLHVDRKFMIKVHLVRECAVMHRQKMEKQTESEGDSDSQDNGIDELYLVQSDEMNIILPRKRFYHGVQSGNSGHIVDQFVAYLMPKYRDITTKIYGLFRSPWISPNDIFNTFRALNQLFIEHKLNAMLKENLKDLQFMSRLQAFYERSRVIPVVSSRNFVVMMGWGIGMMYMTSIVIGLR